MNSSSHPLQISFNRHHGHRCFDLLVEADLEGTAVSFFIQNHSKYSNVDFWICWNKKKRKQIGD